MPKKYTIEDWNCRVKKVNPFLTVTGEHIKNGKEYLDFKCDKCGGVFEKSKEIVGNSGKECPCPVCANKVIVRGINDLSTTDEWLLPFLKDKEYAYTHGRGSTDSVVVICPICKREIKTSLTMVITKRHTICRNCKGKQINQDKRNELREKYGDIQIKLNTMPIEYYRENYKEKQPNLEILNYDENKNVFHIHCKNCGCDFERKRGVASSYRSCPVCSGKKTVKGINDISTTAPFLMKYIVDKDFAYTHSCYSKKKTLMRCPDCGHERLASPSQFMRTKRYVCQVCSDGVSFPNKYGREVLRQLHIHNWICEYQDSWTNGKIYDNYFEYNGKSYVLEMDGDLHFKDSAWDDVENVRQNDNYKDCLCREHGVQMIRIDCKDSSANEIRNNILQSELNTIFDLNNIDWNICEINATKSRIKKVCEYYADNPTITQLELAEIFSTSRDVIRDYLYRGASLGFCEYDSVTAKNNKSLRTSIASGQPVIAYDLNMNILGQYRSKRQAIIDLRKRFPDKKVNEYSINKVLNGEKDNLNGIIFQRVN